MEIVYLIGNGFDLSIGLDSAPDSFLRQFVAEHKDSDNVPKYVFNLARDIEIEGIDKWSSLEEEFGKYSKRIIDNQTGTPSEYVEACSALSKALYLKLTSEIERVTDEYIEQESKDCLETLKTFPLYMQAGDRKKIEKLKQQHLNEDWDYRLLVFNYTNVLDRMFDYKIQEDGNSIGAVLQGRSSAHHLSELIHVHQTLETGLVCGVNDESQITEESFREESFVVDNLIKGRIQRYIRTDDDLRGMKAIEAGVIFCVFGMSLGVTDRRWWKAIADRLQVNKNALLVLISHDFASQNPHTTYEQYLIKNEIEEEFFFAAEVIDEAVKMALRERIIIIPSTGILTVSERITNSLTVNE